MKKLIIILLFFSTLVAKSQSTIEGFYDFKLDKTTLKDVVKDVKGIKVFTYNRDLLDTLSNSKLGYINSFNIVDKQTMKFLKRVHIKKLKISETLTINDIDLYFYNNVLYKISIVYDLEIMSFLKQKYKKLIKDSDPNNVIIDGDVWINTYYEEILYGIDYTDRLQYRINIYNKKSLDNIKKLHDASYNKERLKDVAKI